MEYKNTQMGNVALIVLILVIAIAAVAYIWQQLPLEAEPYDINLEPSPTATTSSTSIVTPRTEVVATGLNIPWDIAFLPDGNILVTERVGNLVELRTDGTRHSIQIPNPIPKGEGGLLGMVLHPDFANNKFIYLYMTTQNSDKGTINAVFRYKFDLGKLFEDKTIISNIPGALYHDGGRMEFGPDGYLYITTGDATSPQIAQNKTSLGGKILRLTADGEIPSDNPFGTAIYSLGHRNPQGLAWDEMGRLWETEHGRSGITSGMDEVNLIEKGKNYGWPNVEGDKTAAGMTVPALHSGASETWAPASALYHEGSLFFGGLRGEALYEAVLDNGSVTELKEHFKGEYGRIRTVRLGPDGLFYITTSNKDGRGKASTNDDQVIRIDPKQLD